MTRKSVVQVSPKLKEVLDQVVAGGDQAARVTADPVSVVREQRSAEDAELAGLLASCLALGNAGVARDRCRAALSRVGSPLTLHLEAPWDEVATRLGNWKHRFYTGEDVAKLLVGARRVQRRWGGLGKRFGALLDEVGTLQGAAARWVEEIQKEGWGKGGPGRMARHLLPIPGEGGSASKRLMLYLRWMVRPDDGVDLGLWTRWMSPAMLVIPVDVHIARLARNMGLTKRATVDWKTAQEITGRLAEFRPGDPVAYDFALCHLGMVQGCPSRRDEARCKGCGVQPVCLHWTATSSQVPKRLKER
ncbi:MAG: TIGR02757 family protein [Myxococcales bacterium]|nr:TIGR02757 family protein [Polyangiaceae bacterium]MDW8250705.1 TIGR02757 family protein [Myxococcales bacterium]